METSSSNPGASSWSAIPTPPMPPTGAVVVRPSTGRATDRVVLLGRVSLGLGVLVVGFLVVSVLASEPAEKAEPAVLEREPVSLIPALSIAPKSPEQPPLTVPRDEPEIGRDAVVGPSTTELIPRVDQVPAISEEAENAAVVPPTETQVTVKKPTQKSMNAWWKGLRIKVNGACDDKVTVETRARVLHVIEGGRVKAVDVKDTENTQLDTCIYSMLNNKIREGWVTSTEPSGAPYQYEFVVKPKVR